MLELPDLSSGKRGGGDVPLKIHFYNIDTVQSIFKGCLLLCHFLGKNYLISLVLEASVYQCCPGEEEGSLPDVLQDGPAQIYLPSSRRA